MDDFDKDMVCTGCGKDPYKSSTGCLCEDDGTPHEWVEGQGTYGPGSAVPDLDDEDDIDRAVFCKCGAERKRAAMNPRQVLPCRKCGDGGRRAVELLGAGAKSANKK